MKRTVPFLALAVALAACTSDSPVPTASHMAGGLMLSDLTQASQAQTLNDLKNLTAPLHDVDAALAQQYGLLVAPPATEGDGCISDPMLGGMGYHYTRWRQLLRRRDRSAQSGVPRVRAEERAAQG